jgi:ATP-binding cassette subfamily B protein
MERPPRRTRFLAELRPIAARARQVWRLVTPRQKGALAAATAVIAVTSICSTALPLLLGTLVDAVLRGMREGWGHASLYRLAGEYLGMIGVAYLVREALNVLRRYLAENACTRINRDMSVRVLGHLLQVDLSRIGREKVGALQGRIFRSVDGFVRFLRLSFLDFIPALCIGLFALTAAVSKQPWLGLLMLGVVPGAVFLTVRQLGSQKGIRLSLMRDCETIEGAVVEQLGGIEYIRAASTERHELQRIDHALERRRARELRHHFQMSLFGCAKALNEAFFHVLVLGVSLYLAIQGTLELGDVIAFSGLFLGVMAPLSEIHLLLDEGHEASLRIGDLVNLLDEPIDRSFITPAAQIPHFSNGAAAVVVRDLHVEYHNGEGRRLRALDGVSLTIHRGETIGVAGRSGSGKTTWIRILLRLVHPSAGDVRLGGVPLEAVCRDELARHIGYVGQTPFVFSGTIADNIAYGCPHASLESIHQAARQAHLHEEIVRMPGGYDAMVTERGQNLSGGQRQRLALARILLQQPPLLILDEATSALDNISERHVQRALGIRRADRTTILIAHRLSTLRDADRIFVFEEGRIVEMGSYEALVAHAGAFAELVRSGDHGLGANGADEHPGF